MGYKEQIVNGANEVEAWVSENKNSATESIRWDVLRQILNRLNPEVHECENDGCAVNTWHGPNSTCPACNVEGKAVGRLAK